MKKITKISKQQLFSLLNEIDGSKPTFVSFISNTDARLKKTNNPYIGTRKISKVTGLLNFNYQNSVNNQRAKEGNEKEFVAKERGYGIKFDDYNGCLLHGSNDIKLIVKVENTLKPKFVFNGKLISKELIKPFLPSSNSAPQQELEKEIIYRNYDLSNIKKISFNKMIYKIVD